MMLNDPLYGKSRVEDSVLVELIKSEPVRRLRWVSKGGLPLKSRTLYARYSRYEHSIGVMLLLRRFGAGLEEQIAGLLHDVSHTAFSHVMDWVMGNVDENYQDSTLSCHILRPPISSILASHGFDAEKISEVESSGRYGLLERKAPDLCADRIDYTLRDAQYGLHYDAMPCLNDLTVCGSEFVFRSRSKARMFGYCYSRCQNSLWSGSPESMLRYYFLSEAIRLAMGNGTIGMKDMYGRERGVVARIRRLGGARERALLRLALGRLRFRVCEDGDIPLRRRRRYVDPKFLDRGRITRLSSVDARFRELIKKERARKATVRVKLVGARPRGGRGIA